MNKLKIPVTTWKHQFWNKNQILEKIIKSFLIPIFALCTKGLLELQQTKMDVKDENRELKKIIKLNEMEKITSATKQRRIRQYGLKQDR